MQSFFFAHGSIAFINDLDNWHKWPNKLLHSVPGEWLPSSREATSFWNPAAHSFKRMLPTSVQGPDGSEWGRLTGRTWKTLRELCRDVSPGSQAEDQAGILKCASTVFQDILSSPLRNGTAGKACSGLRWGRGEAGAMVPCGVKWFSLKRAQTVFDLIFLPPSVGEASESKLDVLWREPQTHNGVNKWEGSGMGSPPRPSASLHPHHQFVRIHSHWPQTPISTCLYIYAAFFFFSKCLFQMLVCIHTVQHCSQPWLCLNVLNNINKQDSVDQH